jgi:transposase
MLNLESFDAIYLCCNPVDMRKSINGLSAMVESELKLNALGRYLFVFCSRRRDKIKILYWDRSGFALWYKRLEEERFRWPRKPSGEVLTLEAHELRWLLNGYDLWKQKPHKTLHYQRIN